MIRESEQIRFQKRHTVGQQVGKKMLNISNHDRNANQNHNEISSHTVGWPLYKTNKQKITSIGEDVKKLEVCELLVGT